MKSLSGFRYFCALGEREREGGSDTERRTGSLCNNYRVRVPKEVNLFASWYACRLWSGLKIEKDHTDLWFVVCAVPHWWRQFFCFDVSVVP